MGKKKGHGRRGGFTLPMAIVVPIAISAIAIGKNLMAGPHGQAIACEQVTGFYPGQKFDWGTFLGTYGPIAAGVGIHWAAGKFGVNKMLGRAKVPFIRI